MANIVIVSTGNYIDVDFGIYATSSGVDGRRATYQKADLSIVYLEKDDSIVYIKMKDYITSSLWLVSFDSTSDALMIDSINGVAPTSNIDLYNKLNALR